MEIIKEITALETFPVRHPSLRAGKSYESCHFEGDNLETTHHFGLFSEDLLVGVITILDNKSPGFNHKKQFQIRGMGVLPSHQKQGIGEKLLRFAEDYIRQQDADLIWFNARIIAVGFYEKSGYQVTGDVFDVADVGPHYIMFKTL